MNLKIARDPFSLKTLLEGRKSLKVAFLLFCLLGLIVLFPHSVDRQLSLGIDYPIYYKAALNRGQAEGYIYPPLLACAIYPLASLPLTVSIQVWYVIQSIVTLCALWICLPGIQIKDKSTIIALIIFAIATARLVALNAELGQVNGLLLLLILVGIRTNRASLSGLSLGLATALKLSPAFFLPYALVHFKQSWKMWLGFFLGTVIIGWTIPWLFGYNFTGITNLSQLVGSASANLGLYEIIGEPSYVLFALFFILSLIVSVRAKGRWEVLLIPLILLMLFVPFVRKANLITGCALGFLIPAFPRRVSLVPLLWAVGTLGTMFWMPSASIGNLVAVSLLLYELWQGDFPPDENLKS